MIGKIITNFKIKKLIGTGGFGEVYFGQHVDTGEKAAIKIVDPELLGNKKVVERFKTEARILENLRHENIVNIKQCGKKFGNYFIRMEYVEGETLDNSDPLSEERAINILRQLLSAVSSMHKKGVIHRDLKPLNVILRKNGTPKIIDFGIARSKSQSKRITGERDIFGSEPYMSPEQRKATKDADEQSDIYSLGVILFQMLKGRPPNYPYDMSRENYSGISTKMEKIIRKATAKEKTYRYKNCEIFSREFKNINEGVKIMSKSIIIGRNTKPYRGYPKSDIILTGLKISRPHARIYKQKDRVYIEDLDSNNGTYVNGNEIKREQEITIADEIYLANEKLDLYDERIKNLFDMGNGEVPYYTWTGRIVYVVLLLLFLIPWFNFGMKTPLGRIGQNVSPIDIAFSFGSISSLLFVIASFGLVFGALSNFIDLGISNIVYKILNFSKIKIPLNVLSVTILVIAFIGILAVRSFSVTWGSVEIANVKITSIPFIFLILNFALVFDRQIDGIFKKR